MLQCSLFVCKIDCYAGASCLTELLKAENSLRELYMGYNYICDDGMSLIADALQCNNTLKVLRVEQCGFSVKGS